VQSLARTAVATVVLRAEWMAGVDLRGGADMSLALPGRKQAAAKKLGIYTTYPPRSSIHFLARCSNFGKPPPQKSKKTVRSTRSLRQQ